MSPLVGVGPAACGAPPCGMGRGAVGGSLCGGGGSSGRRGLLAGATRGVVRVVKTFGRSGLLSPLLGLKKKGSHALYIV